MESFGEGKSANKSNPKNDNMEKGITFLGKGRIWETSTEIKTLVKHLNEQNPVHFLNLEGNRLSMDAAKAIGAALGRHPEFRTALWKNIFKNAKIPEIPQSLRYLGGGLISAGAKLVVLNLSDNPLGPTGILGLAELFSSSVCYSLEKLLLNNCALGPEGATALSKALVDLSGNAAKAGSPLKLRIFEGGRNKLETVGCQALANAFKELKTLEEVSLTENLIDHEGAAYLAESFKENPGLQVLNLNDNKLTGAGAAKIADILPSLSQLRDIDLGGCFIRSSGAHYLAKTLKDSNEMLQKVNLAKNKFLLDGGLALVAAMKNKPGLGLFNIDGNFFGPRGCQQLRGAMAKQNKGVKVVVTEECSCDLPFPTANQQDSEVDDGSEDDPPTAAAKEFVCHRKPCTLEQFNALGSANKLQDLRRVINVVKENKHLLLLVFTSMKCAHLSQASKEALELAISLFHLAFDYASKTNQVTRVVNYFLLHMGLMESEKKEKPEETIQPKDRKRSSTTAELEDEQDVAGKRQRLQNPFDIQSCRFALREAIGRPEFATDAIKNRLKELLNKIDG